MSLNLTPRKAGLKDFISWFHDAKKLIMKDPVSFFLAFLFTMAPFGIANSVVFMAEQAFFFQSESKIVEAIERFFALATGIIAIVAIPMGLSLSIVAEKVDRNEKIKWESDVYRPIVDMYREYFSKVSMPFFFYAMIFFSVVLLLIPSSQSGTDVVDASKTLEQPWLLALSAFAMPGYSLVASTFVVPVYYYHLISKGIIGFDVAKAAYRASAREGIAWRYWGMTYLFMFAIFSFPTTGGSEIIAIVSMLCYSAITIVFWSMGYVMSKDMFLGEKGIKEKEKKEAEVSGMVKA